MTWPNIPVDLTAHSVRFFDYACVFSCGPQLTAGVDMIDIASDCAKRTYKTDFWRNRCVNHHCFMICTQGKS
jgi:hypothetical protein